FNALAGGRVGGRHFLADSNLDWGQGLRSLARLQRDRPEFRDLTLYYFGDTEPWRYGVLATGYVVNAVDPTRGLPERFEAATRYVAVSASLQWGPWGPPGYFRALEKAQPVRLTDDTTIAIYRTADVFSEVETRQSEPPRAPLQGRPAPMGWGPDDSPTTRHGTEDKPEERQRPDDAGDPGVSRPSE
ncbi:MAG: hypothetical protein LC745_08930, partial [Planctomycetia bacterium]|nr:hypothetical protein [Planctomycetia bacterium]